MKYVEEQFGWIMNGSLLLVTFLILLLFLFKIGDNPLGVFSLLFAVGIILLVFLMFFKLKITIEEKYIVVSFGIGIVKSKFLIEDIATIKRVKNPWYLGWGIHYFNNGILYNIQGFEAVELSFKNKKKLVRIGVSSRSKILQEIERRIVKKS